MGTLTYMALWTIPEKWWTGHTTPDLLYRVRFRFGAADGFAAADRVWWELVAERPATPDGHVLVGGAALSRSSTTDIEVISAGEDALDSLDFAVNHTLATAVAKAGVPRPALVVTSRHASDA